MQRNGDLYEEKAVEAILIMAFFGRPSTGNRHFLIVFEQETFLPVLPFFYCQVISLSMSAPSS